MVYLNAILFCWMFSHFILKTQSDLLEGILLGSALKGDDSQESEILVIRIPRQRSAKKAKKSDKTRVTTTTTTSTTTTTESPTTTTTTARTTPRTTTSKYYDFNFDSMDSTVRTHNSTPLIESTEYSKETSVTTENICGTNQTYTHCLNECGNRCTDRTVNKICPTHCYGFGCTCAPSFVRDPRTDRCMKPSDCPRQLKCSSGERFFVCGGCRPTCEKPIPVCPRICRSEGGCDCIRGLVRNIHGKCVPLGLCPLSDPKIDLTAKQSVYKTNSTKITQNSLGKSFPFRQLIDNINENHYIFD